MALAKRGILLFCPMDGGEAKNRFTGPGVMFPHCVRCVSCGVTTPGCRTKEQAEAVWNRRVARKPARRAAPLD